MKRIIGLSNTKHICKCSINTYEILHVVMEISGKSTGLCATINMRCLVNCTLSAIDTLLLNYLLCDLPSTI